jgi:hypothetical protein
VRAAHVRGGYVALPATDDEIARLFRKQITEDQLHTPRKANRTIFRTSEGIVKRIVFVRREDLYFVCALSAEFQHDEANPSVQSASTAALCFLEQLSVFTEVEPQTQ